MIKKATKLFILLAMLIMALPMTVLATDPTIGGGYKDPTNPSETPETPPGEGEEQSCNYSTAGTKTSQFCDINVKNEYETAVYMDLYDSDGTYLGNPFGDTFKNKKFKAGMYIGIDFFEEYRVISTATIEPSCTSTTVTLTCTKDIYVACPSASSSSSPSISKPGKSSSYYNPRDPIPRNYDVKYDNQSSENKSVSNKNAKVTPMVAVPAPTDGGSCGYTYKDTITVTEEGGTCPEGYTAAATCSPGKCTPTKTVSDCRDEAESKLQVAKDNENVHYKAYRCDVNDINQKDDNNERCKIFVNPQRELEPGEVLPKDRNSSTITRESYLRIKYNPKKACMNVQTAAIHYIEYNAACDSKIEITVKEIKNDEGKPVGLYFIPLNTKTTQDFKYQMTANDSVDGRLCQDIIERYKTDGRWRDALLYIDNDIGKEFPAGISADDAKGLVAGGCYYSTTVHFIINQDFYKETGPTTKKIRGYELFYRPIDISNPFPNGISAKSYWKNLINNDNVITVTNASNIKKTYKLADSFSNWSYYIYDIDANAIRDYNKDNFYTSWVKMNPDGTSDFIRRFNITRNRSNQEFYKLGCGPANSDWEECKS